MLETLYDLLIAARPHTEARQLLAIAATSGDILQDQYSCIHERVACVMVGLLGVRHVYSLEKVVRDYVDAVPATDYIRTLVCVERLEEVKAAIAYAQAKAVEKTARKLTSYTCMQLPVDHYLELERLPVALADSTVAAPAIFAGAPMLWNTSWARAVTVAQLSDELGLHKLSTYRLLIQDCILHAEATAPEKLNSSTYFATLKAAVSSAYEDASAHIKHKLGVTLE